MSNYSEQEVKNDLEVTREMSDANFRKIGNIEVKIRPGNFDDIQNKNTTIGYIDQVMTKLVQDLNNAFVPELNSSLIENTEEMLKLHKDSLKAIDKLADYSSNLNKLIETNTENCKILKEELDNLKSEIEKSKISDDKIDEWHVPATYDMF